MINATGLVSRTSAPTSLASLVGLGPVGWPARLAMTCLLYLHLIDVYTVK